MPKTRADLTTKIRLLADKYPDDFELQDGKLSCKLCRKIIKFDAKHGSHAVKSHLNTNKHTRKKEGLDDGSGTRNGSIAREKKIRKEPKEIIAKKPMTRETKLQAKMKVFAQKFPDEVEVVNEKLMCKVCRQQIKFDINHGVDRITTHLKAKKHIQQKELQQNDVKKGSASISPAKAMKLESESLKSLAKMMIECDIPLNKVNHESFKKWYESALKMTCPDEKSLKTVYVDGTYERTLSEIRKIIGNDDIYIIIEETSDKGNGNVLNIFAGILNGNVSNPMLVKTNVMPSANNTTILQCVMDACFLIWPKNLQFDKVVMILTDQSSYTLQAMNQIKNIFPNVHHITCLVNALHRVAEKIKEEHDQVSDLVLYVKQILAKSRKRQHLFESVTGLSLPPKARQNKCGSWLTTALFYSKNLAKVCLFIDALGESTIAMRKAKSLITSPTLPSQLFNLLQYEYLPESILLLEEKGLAATRQMAIFSPIKFKLLESSCQKWESILDCNPDLHKFISQENTMEHKIKTIFAPFVSVDIEKNLPSYKRVLSDIHQRMSNETIERLLVIQFNKFLNVN